MQAAALLSHPRVFFLVAVSLCSGAVLEPDVEHSKKHGPFCRSSLEADLVSFGLIFSTDLEATTHPNV